MHPLRERWIPIACVLVGAPIGAEYLQAYLPSTGDALVMFGSLLVLGPLYGGAALLIRETAVRRGLGWTGILVLAASFGVAMTGVVDLSLFGEHRADVSFWEEMREGTLIAPLGISAYGPLTWTAGHVVLSVGTPLALLDALAPRHRGRSLLGRRGIVATGALWLVAAALIREDGVRIYDMRPSVAQTGIVLGVVVVLVALGRSRLGRPVSPVGPRPSPSSGVGWILAAGVAGVLVLDSAPWTWAGVGVLGAVLAGLVASARRRAARRGWDLREVGALAAGALVGRSLSGFLAPVPEGVPVAAKLAQNGLLLAATLGIAWLVVRRAAGSPPRRGVSSAAEGLAADRPGGDLASSTRSGVGGALDVPRPRVRSAKIVRSWRA